MSVIDDLLTTDGRDDISAEFAAIAAMIDRADQHGVLIEVIRSFGESRAEGAGVDEAAAAALYEWDV